MDEWCREERGKTKKEENGNDDDPAEVIGHFAPYVGLDGGDNCMASSHNRSVSLPARIELNQSGGWSQPTGSEFPGSTVDLRGRPATRERVGELIARAVAQALGRKL
jgi:hypothetical protein